MKVLVTIFGLLYLIPTFTFAAETPAGCHEMAIAATDIARINDANYAAPASQNAESPVESAKGQEFSSQFDAYQVRFKTVDGKKDGGRLERVAVIKVTALRKKNEEECRVLTVDYSGLKEMKVVLNK